MNLLNGWNFWWTLAASAVAAIDFVSLVFLAAWARKRIDLIDSFWGPTFIVVALTAMLLGGSKPFSAWLVFGLIVVWGVRLWWHIFRRFLRSNKQDARYTALAAKWPPRYKWAQVYLRIYLVQGLLAVIISLPMIAIAGGGTTIKTPYVVLGAAVWLTGFICEAVADRQLATFVSDKNNQGKLMTKGLWHYSRHPNYFGEVTQWWGIWIVSIGSHYSWLAVIGPLTLTYLILFVSGVPPAEERAANKPGWASYKKRTSVLVPLPPSGK